MNDLSPHAPLPPGFELDEYVIENRLGQPGGFGITYSALRRRGGARVALKELFPPDLVHRRPDGKVLAAGDKKQIFNEAKRIFRREAEILSRVQHDNVVRVLDYLETLGTGYLVMRYEEGHDLAHELQARGARRMTEAELLALLLPVLEGLEAVHQLDYLHRDIKPSNIYLTKGNKPVLIDFGSSKTSLGQKSGNIMVSEGYSPYELYFSDGRSDGREGPYTDIYSLGVVLFTAMTLGETFPRALDRAQSDTFVPLSDRLSGSEYSPHFLAAVDWALQRRGGDRPQTVEAWRGALVLRKRSPQRRNVGTAETFRFSLHPALWGVLIFILVTLVILALLLWFQ
jgi:serine/threonine protein kinase